VKHARLLIGLMAIAAFLDACGPSGETGKAVAVSKEAAYQRGHLLYQTMEYAAAEPELLRAVALDSTWADPFVDLGGIRYELGKRVEGEKNPQRLESFRLARRYFARAEALGARDGAMYERLCEIDLALDDAKGFLHYAKKTAALYPFDRQYYNLGLAYFGVEDWQGVIKSQKEAADRFRQSPYLGGFYRQMGRAYVKLDRDQTAERTLVTGVQAVDARLAVKSVAGDERKRLVDDKIGMLLLLKRLHTTYGAADKLANVEKQLKESGYQK
jgi:tetratricopeptide (TPR) repeat protein